MDLIYSKQEFLNSFNLDKSVTFQEFSDRLSVLNGSDISGQFVVRDHIDGFLTKWAKNDDRLQRLDTYKRKLYRMIVEQPEIALGQWYDKTVSVGEPLEFYFDIPDTDILDGDTFAGRTNAKYGRVCKNINFDKFYSTKKLYANDFEYTLGLMKAMFEDFKIRNSLAAPAFFDHVCKIKDDDYSQVWTDFMIGCNRASIFNPATYKGILDKLFDGSTLFAPCMGWNAYQLGFYSSKFDHLVATDVIPEVVKNGHKLHENWKQYRDNSIFEVADKKVKLYCSPSESLRQTDMVSTYQGQVDAVLFSPPYYDLEIYDSPDQSFSNYPDYARWLEEYWAETIKICEQVLKPGGRLAFVISNYRNKAKQEVTISQDMKCVVDRYLRPIGQYRVQWSAIATGRQAKKTREGNFEDLWLYQKP